MTSGNWMVDAQERGDFDPPEVVEDGLSGWVWNRDLRGADFHRSLYRFAHGSLATSIGGEDVVFSRTRATIYPTEEAALLALAAYQHKRAKAHEQKAEKVMRRYTRLRTTLPE